MRDERMTLEERKLLVAEKFGELFGGEPQMWSRAPGRVDLMGSHTDYNQGYVMTMTIDRDTWIAARPRQDGRVRIQSLNAARGDEFELEGLEQSRGCNWVDYMRGTAWALQQAGYQLRGFDGLVHSRVPIGSGLSSSAALEMAAAVMFQQTSGFTLEPVEMALIGQTGENQYVGMNCGILDQYSSALGQAGSALLLDCRSLESRATPMAAGLQVVICDTRAERNLAGTEYGERRAQCEQGVESLRKYYPGIEALRDVSLEQLESHKKELPELVYKRCRFIIEENQRVLELAQALPGGDPGRLGELFRESYRGACELYEIGAPAMEAMAQAMLRAPGVIGARQTGAGFGGCLVGLVQEEAVEAFAEQVANGYAQRTGIQPQVYPVRAAAGAGVLM
jgi:galactokinase